MTETSFMKGFAYPRFILNRQSFVATNTNFKYITLLMDLLESHPEMFEETSTTLLYILNLGSNYKSEILFDMFKGFIYTDFNKNNEIVADTIPILFTYYLLIHKTFKPFEPSLDLVHEELKKFLNNPTVYYNSREYRINELKPLFYTLSGFNFTEFLIYYAYVITYLIYGAPYQFYNEIGTASAAKGMLTDIDQYFEGCLRLLTKETQIPIMSFNAEELYKQYQQAEQLKGLQGCLNKMLSFEEIIKLRNREMNKTTELLNQNYTNQNQLTPEFIKVHFLDTIDKLINISVNNNPFVKVIEHIPTFTPCDLLFSTGSSRPINFDELMDITEYCISGGTSNFYIDNELNYYHVDDNFNGNDIFKKQSFKTNINVFKRCMKIPFSNADIVLKMLITYIRQKFLAQQDSFLDTPEIGMDVTEPIKIDHTIFTGKLFDYAYNNFMTGYYYPALNELEIIIKNLNSQFQIEYEDIKNMWDIASKIYSSKPKAMVLSIYLLSWLKESIDMYIKTGVNNFNKYLFMNYLTHFITNVYTEECEKKMFKIYDMLIAYGFCLTDEYARFINTCEQDFEQHLMNSLLFNVYISGNTDMCEIYSIGGTNLYSKMIDVNPFNRGYEFIKSLFGINQELIYTHDVLQLFKDSSLINLIENTDSIETIYNVMKRYTRDNELKFDYNIKHYSFIVNKDSEITIQRKNMGHWIDLKYGEKYIFEYFLNYAFEQIKGNYHDNEFRSKQLKINENGNVDASENETINIIRCNENNETHDLPVDFTIGDNYTMPVLKYVGGWENMKIKFINPIGTRLIKFDLRSNDHNYSSCIFMFTSAKLDTKFNIYA